MASAAKSPAALRWFPHRRLRPIPGFRPARRQGLYDGEPETCRRRPREFLAILAQLGLMLAVFDAYRLETRSFRLVVLLAMLALPFHQLAPFRWKKSIFVAVSILGMVLVHGMA